MSKEIPLTQGKFAIVDDEDYENLIQFKWCCSHGYASRTIYHPTKKTINMSSDIISFKGKVRHINGNRLDNQKSNLEPYIPFSEPINRQKSAVLISEWMQENKFTRKKAKGKTSKYKGVCWNNEKNKWQAQLTINKKHIFLGYFLDEEEAAISYNKAVIENYGNKNIKLNLA